MKRKIKTKIVKCAGFALFVCFVMTAVIATLPFAKSSPPYGGPVDTTASKDLGVGASIAYVEPTFFKSNGNSIMGAPAGPTLFVSYINSTDHTLMLAKTTTFPYSSTSDWTRECVDKSVNCYYYTSIFLDGKGINIAYFEGSPNYDLRYAYYNWSTSTWTKQDVLTTNSVGWCPSITGNGAYILISCIENTNGYVYCKTTINHGTSWSATETIASEWGGDTCIYYYSSKYYCSWYDSGNGNLRYNVRTSGSWGAASDVDTTNDVGKYSSLKIDGTYIYIAYYENTNHNLRWAYKTIAGASWTTNDVETTGDVGSYCSLTLYSGSGSSRMYISYYDVTNTNLKYAYKATGTGTSWTISTVWSSANDVGRCTSCVGGGPSSPSDQRAIHIACQDVTNTDQYCKAVAP